MSPMVVFGGQDLEWIFSLLSLFSSALFGKRPGRERLTTHGSLLEERPSQRPHPHRALCPAKHGHLLTTLDFSTRAFLQDRRTVKLSAWHNPPTMLTSWKPVFLPKIHANFVLYFTIYCWSIKMSLVVYHEAKLRVQENAPGLSCDSPWAQPSQVVHW